MNAVAKKEADQIVPMSDAASLMEVISRAATDPATDIGKLERLMSLYERITAQSAKQSFDAAMVAAQMEMRPIAADADNSQTKSKYASYAALDKAMRPIYTRHGFGLSFNTGDGAPENAVRVICDVSHSGGNSRQYHIDMPADGKGAKGGDVMTKTHATGSAVSYGTRYLLKMIFNVAVGPDDDGNAASDDGKFISEQQIAEIRQLIDEAHTDPEAFCTFAKIESLAEIRAKDYHEAVTVLRNRKAAADAKLKTKP